jgi:DNA-binding protein YbaB
MTVPLHNDLEAALVRLRDQQQELTATTKAIAEAETSTSSRDRLIEATVDGQGRLTGLKITGRRFRELSAAELAAKIVETVRAAQDEQTTKTATALARFAPPGVDLAAMIDGSASPADLLAAAGASMADGIAGGLLGGLELRLS